MSISSDKQAGAVGATKTVCSERSTTSILSHVAGITVARSRATTARCSAFLAKVGTTSCSQQIELTLAADVGTSSFTEEGEQSRRDTISILC